MSFRIWHLFAAIAVIGAGLQLFLAFSPSPRAVFVVQFVLLTFGPLIAFACATFSQGQRKKFFTGGAIAALGPWIVAYFLAIERWPQMLSSSPEMDIATPMVWTQKGLYDSVQSQISLLLPWLAFFAGGAITVIAYQCFRLICLLPGKSRLR